MRKYLYGGNVNGIQSYIFKTNKLKEIVGASELIELVTKKLPSELLNEIGATEYKIILQAAGHIRILFHSEQACRDFYQRFPMKLAEKAPGLEFAQAVIQVEENLNKGLWDKLEDRLRVQRNITMPPAFPGLMAMQLSRRTGEPAVQKELPAEKIEFPDASTVAKIESYDKKEFLDKKSKPKEYELYEMPTNMEQWCHEGEWLAVIHADANSLGKKLLQLWQTKWNNTPNPEENLKAFSAQLEYATERAFKEAVIKTFDIADFKDSQLSYRTIVIGGDDITLVCKAKDAISLTKTFLESFEEKTKSVEDLKPEGLTACAGIAFVKSNYPFSQAYKLSEELCKAAKDGSKAINPANPPSSLLFYKVQSSTIQSFEQIVQSELICESGLSFKAGPYALDNDQISGLISLSKLLETVRKIKGFDAMHDKKGVKSKMRQWLALVKKENTIEEANQLLKLLRENNKLKNEHLQSLGLIEQGNSIAMDALTLSGMINE